MDHEHIIASGIYYFEQQNIGPSSLEFTSISTQYYPRGGRCGGGLVISELKGSITTSEDQCIVFPNTLEHAVSDFKTQDDTKNGYRKQLVFFLIDPSKQIISTSTVPPQQPEWLIEALQTYQCFGRSFPYDVIPLIVSFMTPFYDKEVVKKFRDALVMERKNANDPKKRQFKFRTSLMD